METIMHGGELKPKQFYDKNTYNQTLCKKYNKDSFHILQPEDDIVTQTYYGIDKFRMPTKEEMEELLDESKITHVWQTNYRGIKNLNGIEFISKINGNFIFIPAAGEYIKNNCCDAYSYCYLWSNSLYIKYSRGVYGFGINSYKTGVCDFDRYFGFFYSWYLFIIFSLQK